MFPFTKILTATVLLLHSLLGCSWHQACACDWSGVGKLPVSGLAVNSCGRSEPPVRKRADPKRVVEVLEHASCCCQHEQHNVHSETFVSDTDHLESVPCDHDGGCWCELAGRFVGSSSASISSEKHCIGFATVQLSWDDSASQIRRALDDVSRRGRSIVSQWDVRALECCARLCSWQV